jgi:hypothetical protein
MVDEFLAILDRHNLSTEEAAVLVGVAPHTIRCVRLSGALPKREHCRTAIAEFCARNRAAVTREGLRMPADRRFHPTPEPHPAA